MNISSGRNYVEVTVECINNDRLNEAWKMAKLISLKRPVIFLHHQIGGRLESGACVSTSTVATVAETKI